MRSPRLFLLPIFLLAMIFAGSLSALAQEPPPDRRSDAEKARDYAKEAPEIVKDGCRTPRVDSWIRFLDRQLPDYERQSASDRKQITDDLAAGRSPPDRLVREAQLLAEAIPVLTQALAELKQLPPCEAKTPQTNSPPGGAQPPLPPRVAHRTTICPSKCQEWADKYNEAADNYALARGAGPPEAAAYYRAQMQEFARQLDLCEQGCRPQTLTVPAPTPTPATPQPAPGNPPFPGPEDRPYPNLFGETGALKATCRTPAVVEAIAWEGRWLSHMESERAKWQRDLTDAALQQPPDRERMGDAERRIRVLTKYIEQRERILRILEAKPPCRLEAPQTAPSPAPPQPAPTPTPATPPMPAPSPTPPPPPPGAMMPLVPGVQFYAGVTGGGATARSQVKQPGETTAETSTTTPDPTSKVFDLSGGLAGGLFGIEVQNGPWRFGVETDIAGGSISGKTTAGCGVPCRASNDWLATVRGRAGYDFGLATPYVTGGLAVGDVNARIGALPGGSTVAAGWTAGAGLQWPLAAFGFGLPDAVTGRLEWLHADLGNPRVCGPKACGGVTNASFSSDIFRLGVAIPLSILLPR